jgi:hypothetical protein
MLTFVMGWFFGVISAAIGLAWYRIASEPPVVHNGPPRSAEDLGQLRGSQSEAMRRLHENPNLGTAPERLR